MAAPSDVLVRIDEIEEELHGLSDELREIRSLVVRASATPEAEVAAVTPPPIRQPAAAAPPLDPAARLETAITTARIALSDGRPTAALDELERALDFSRNDPDALNRLVSVLEGIARYNAKARPRALELAARAGGPTEQAPVAAPAAPTALPEAPVAPVEPTPPRRTLSDLANDWDLLGPRGFAIIGGAVTAFGVILLFVLAANRGWLTPTMRVLFGAGVSAAAVSAGFWVRSRYGQMQMSLGAAGAGIAGGYATLAAAAARYDIVPDAPALPLAGGIAAAAVLIAIAWSSETVAAIGLLGAALAPALQALDSELKWPAVAFAVIILAAAVVLSVPRGWRKLLIGITAVVGLQVAWLAVDVGSPAGAGAIAVVAAFVLVVLAAGIWLQLVAGKADLDPLATSFMLAAVGLALLLSRPLFDVDRDRGLALIGAAAVWAMGCAALRLRQQSLALVLGVSSLSLAAVATADLLSGTGIALTWAVEALLLAWIASRFRDARLQAVGLAYCGLTAAHVFLVDAPPQLLFHAPVPGMAAASVAALACALVGNGLLAAAETTARTEGGLLAWLAGVRSWLADHRVGLQESLLLGGAAAATYTVAILLTAWSFEQGHLAATIAAATAGAAAVAVASRRGSRGLLAASFVWVAGVFAIAIAFDVPEFALEAAQRSYGGWALIGASAGLLAGCFAFQLLFTDPGTPFVPALGGATALAGAAWGIALISPAGEIAESTWIGWRLLAPVLVLVALAAAVFRIPRHRDLATTMWSLATVALLASEWLVVRDATWRAVAYAATAAAFALLARPLRERRLWLAGWGVGSATGFVTVVLLAAMWAIDGAEPARHATAAFAIAAALVGVAALAWGEQRRRNLVTVAWTIAFGAVIAGEAFLTGGGTATAFVVALTGASVALLTMPLHEQRLWWAGAVVVSATSAVVVAVITPPSHFISASASPASGLWVAVACVAAGVVLRIAAPAYERWIDPIVGVGALYVLSLGILDLAERAFGGSIEADFERGHVAVSVLWTLIGLGLLVAGLVRDQRLLRYGGLALFGLSLAKIFLYDLSALNSAARALSFIVVGALVLAGGFFLQRLTARMGPSRPTG